MKVQRGSKNFERKLESESSKRTMFARGGLGRLQMILELDTGRWAREEVNFEILYQLERRTKHFL